MSGARERFEGRIAGLGTTSGLRVVVGSWHRSPYGRFADVMLAEPDGTRRLLAPTEQVAGFVASTYTFDEVLVGEVEVESKAGDEVGEHEWWQVRAPGLDLDLEVGRRSVLGRLLRVVPRRLATSAAWCTLTDPVARVVLRGVRTRGTAGNGRREYYGATDLHEVLGVSGTWHGRPVGDLAPVWPEPHFGFGSTPARPSVTSLVTTVTRPG